MEKGVQPAAKVAKRCVASGMGSRFCNAEKGRLQTAGRRRRLSLSSPLAENQYRTVRDSSEKSTRIRTA